MVVTPIPDEDNSRLSPSKHRLMPGAVPSGSARSSVDPRGLCVSNITSENGSKTDHIIFRTHEEKKKKKKRKRDFDDSDGEPGHTLKHITIIERN